MLLIPYYAMLHLIFYIKSILSYLLLYTYYRIMALYSDNQPMDCLNLSENYVSHWTYLQGLRELYSNFMDACIEEHPEFKLLHRKDPTPNLVIFTQSRRVGNNLE